MMKNSNTNPIETNKYLLINKDAFIEGFCLSPNLLAINVSNCMQITGMELSKVAYKDYSKFLDSNITSASDLAVDFIKDTFDVYKKFSDNLDGIADTATYFFNRTKDSVADVTNSMADVTNSMADVVKECANVVVDATREIGGIVENRAGAVKNAAEEVGEAIYDTAGDVDDATSDEWDEVEELFSGIF